MRCLLSVFGLVSHVLGTLILIAVDQESVLAVFRFCYDEFDVSEVTVRRWLSISRYTRKKLQRKAAERNLTVWDG